MECRSVQLLAYFGEKNAPRCAKCDVCRHRNEINLTKYEFDSIVEKITEILAQAPSSVEDIVKQIEKPDKTIKVIRQLMDNGKISEQKNLLELKN
jgi:ATP-dependent DNA helicase RecQ